MQPLACMACTCIRAAAFAGTPAKDDVGVLFRSLAADSFSSEPDHRRYKRRTQSDHLMRRYKEGSLLALRPRCLHAVLCFLHSMQNDYKDGTRHTTASVLSSCFVCKLSFYVAV